MIIQEMLENNMVRTYSDAGFYIHGGFPEGDYAEAIDPVSMNRVYTETDIPIEVETEPEDLNEEAEYAMAGKIFMGVVK